MGRRDTGQNQSSGSSRRSRVHVLDGFLPCVREWFEATFAAPSPAQAMAWPVVCRRENTLLLAPTGSGKTLAVFLCAIDDLLRRAGEGGVPEGIQVLYISPLKALGNDIHKNLVDPLAQIRDRAGEGVPEIRVAVRTGDTTQAERAAMVRRPPHILITTPESLFLLLGSRRMAPHLETVRTVIVDEVHALCDSKRGVHLALSLERLVERVAGPMQRLGCSATLSPLDEIAAFLVGRGVGGQPRDCHIVDTGVRKDLDVCVLAPLPDFLEADLSALWSSAYELLLREIATHDTTLVFCNSRYKAERTALRLEELAAGTARIGVHHGSMSKELRLRAEDDLKCGRLDALVATASLELGIDIGSVDLVIQLESAKSVATGLQRIGRAGHLLDSTSKGRMLIFERDELLEAAAVCHGMVQGEVDAIRLPRGCLDVLGQQIAGMVAVRDWPCDEILRLVRRAYPYTDLSLADFESVLRMLAGELPFAMNMPPRPLVLWDRVSGRLSAARGAAHVCATCVGTIPEDSEYDVVIEATGKRVGKVQSAFVDDCLRTGDVFVLGSTCWRLAAVKRNRLLVREAPGAAPTVPWWSGPVESRTTEVGRAIGVLRRGIAQRLADPALASWLQQEYRLSESAASALVDYVLDQKQACGTVPDHEHMLVETWRDELGRANVIVHCPLGERLNRAWGVALSEGAKEELGQSWSACASNDLLMLTLQGAPTQRFGVAETRRLLATVSADSVREMIRRTTNSGAVLTSTFREVAACALQVLRSQRGTRVPFWLQSYRAGELFEACGGDQAYPVVAEVVRSYIEEALDVPGLAGVLGSIASGDVSLAIQAVEAPSPFSHSLLVRDWCRGSEGMGRARRASLLRLHRKVLREVLDEEQLSAVLDPRAMERVEQRRSRRDERVRARSADELAQAIRELGEVPADPAEVAGIASGDVAGMLRSLVGQGRVVAFAVPDCEVHPVRLVAADLWREHHDAYVPHKRGQRLHVLRPRLEAGPQWTFERVSAASVIPPQLRLPGPAREARQSVLARFLRSRGPVTAYEVLNHTGWPMGVVDDTLGRLVSEGKAARGVYRADKPRPQWVDKTNLEEIHRLTMGYLRRELRAAPPYAAVDFMTRWQHRHPDTRLVGIEGLRQVVRQLQGFEVIAGALEQEVLAGRLVDYRPEMLEKLMAAGEVCWRRVGHGVKRGKLALCLVEDVEWLGRGCEGGFDVEGGADEDIRDTILAVRACFQQHGEVYFDDLLAETGGAEGPLTRAVFYLAWCGELRCDTFECVRHAGFRSPLSACYDLRGTPGRILSGRMAAEDVVERMKRRRLDPRLALWSATERLTGVRETWSAEHVARRWAGQLLARWGIVTRDILRAEAAAPAWSRLVPELKRFELLGNVHRGYFIAGHHGEQYALPDALELLRDCTARRPEGERLGFIPGEPVFAIAGCDPANLYSSCTGVIREDGEGMDRALGRAGTAHCYILQAGQVLLLDSRQIVTLTSGQLRQCLAAYRRGPSGQELLTSFREWNGHPIDLSPVAGLLWQLGFRFGKPGEMTWPPSRDTGCRPPVPEQETFPPHYLEPPPAEYGPEWALRRAPPAVRAVLSRVLEFLVRAVGRPGWSLLWDSGEPLASYRGRATVGVRVHRHCVDVVYRSPVAREGAGRQQRFASTKRIRQDEDVGPSFSDHLRATVARLEELVDEQMAREDGFAEGRRAQTKTRENEAVPRPEAPARPEGERPREPRDAAGATSAQAGSEVIRINRAPVLTLWGAVVAERLGHDWEAALSLGRCLSGLNAQTKGRRLGIYEVPESVDGVPQLKSGLGEDLWIEICGRSLPAKETPKGIRAVVGQTPISPASVRRYLDGKLGPRFADVAAAMRDLAWSYSANELRGVAWELYERFRPEIPGGRRGWGAWGELDPAIIRSLSASRAG